ncbi:hypothetical protein C8J57DRAFT_119730 [Mycena rebaudengoi]|nr:hypothetical protein C8J57DRAFT_119730 [Mycena rebaudengoi]
MTRKTVYARKERVESVDAAGRDSGQWGWRRQGGDIIAIRRGNAGHMHDVLHDDERAQREAAARALWRLSPLSWAWALGHHKFTQQTIMAAHTPRGRRSTSPSAANSDSAGAGGGGVRNDSSCGRRGMALRRAARLTGTIVPAAWGGIRIRGTPCRRRRGTARTPRRTMQTRTSTQRTRRRATAQGTSTQRTLMQRWTIRMRLRAGRHLVQLRRQSYAQKWLPYAETAPTVTEPITAATPGTANCTASRRSWRHGVQRGRGRRRPVRV